MVPQGPIKANRRRTLREESPRQTSKETKAPKNGRLTLLVVGTFVLMGGLGFFTYRHVSDPSVSPKLAARSAKSGGHSAWHSDAASGSRESHGQAAYVPPKVTFYNELTESDDEGDSTPSARGELSTSAASSDAAESMTPTGTQVSGNRSLAASEAPRATGTSQRNNRTTIPEAGKGPKVYTVQVGAFTNPGIAQQWAQEWKARGYNVSLKPVARPRTGVIYRLYLGEFSSEKKADELVKRLRQNEGISAIRLVVRN